MTGNSYLSDGSDGSTAHGQRQAHSDAEALAQKVMVISLSTTLSSPVTLYLQHPSQDPSQWCHCSHRKVGPNEY